MVSLAHELLQHVLSILDFTKIFDTTHPRLLSLPVTESLTFHDHLVKGGL